MKDTIYREDAIRAVCKGCREEFKECAHHWSCPKLNELASVPSADRPQGEWISIGTISHSYKCSVCGRTLFHTTVGKSHVAKNYPYCHCGAKMKGADDE